MHIRVSLPLLVVSVLVRVSVATQYFVKPTNEANNNSCPGQPCLTLAQYINNTEHYFKSNNHSLFWFLSGEHHISSPMIITGAYNVTLMGYNNQLPLVVFTPVNYCGCTLNFPIYNVCSECSIIQFINVSMINIHGLSVQGSTYNDTSSINGISFEKSENIFAANMKIIQLNNTCTTGHICPVAGIFLYRTFLSFINNLTTLSGAVVLQTTVNTSLDNITLSYSQMFANHTIITSIHYATVVHSINSGISSWQGLETVIEHVNVRNTDGHCIRIGGGRNTSISGAHATQCKENGIEVRGGINTLIRDSFFGNLGTPVPTSAAIGLLNTSKTTIQNITVDVDFPIYSIACFLSKTTQISNIFILGSQSLVVLDSKSTQLQGITTANSVSGIQLFNSAEIRVLNSSIMISAINESTTAVSLSSSSDTLLHNITMNSSVVISDSTNVCIDSVTVTAIQVKFAMSTYKSNNVTIENCCFTELGTRVSDIPVTDHPAIVFLYHSMNINFKNCVFSRNTISAVQAIASNLTLSGSVLFANSTALLGAAVILQQNSVMTLATLSSVKFVNNHATSVGGAVYVDGDSFYTSTDQGGVYFSSVCMLEMESGNHTTLEFYNNSAGNGGDVVYGGHMGLATTTDGYNCLQQFKQVSGINQTNTLSVISSQPSRVCVCTSTGVPDCLNVFFSHNVYPGESISLETVVVGQDFGTGTGSVYGQFLPSEVQNRAQLEQWQYSQRVTQAHCNQVTYTILAVPTESTVLVLTAVEMAEVQVVSNNTVHSALAKYKTFQSGSGPFPQELLNFPVYINITVQPCPPGFSLSESLYKCICSHQLRQLQRVKCYIENKMFERSGTSWIGLSKNGDLIVSQNCFFSFCKDIQQNITLSDLDLQCNYKHSGVLCGGCKRGYSVAVGSNRCLRCSNIYISLLIPIVLAGLVLVLGIKALDITVSSGYINGLALYFNAIQPTWALVLPQGLNSVVTIIVAWTNLDFGIESCFFDGFTPYWKTWLQFLFPLYLWGISGTLIMCARYSNKVASLMGSNPVSLLATLFLLSYTKLLRTCIDIISYSYVEYHNSSIMVWSSDGNIEYLGAKHLPLFFVAVAMLVFLCVPYTLTLLLGQWLKKCENRFVSRAMFRIKPIMDAYYGPLKDNHCYWIGVLLLSRAFIHVVLALTPSSSHQLTLTLATSLLAICLLQMSAYVMGFYRRRYVSLFELTIISNLAFYSLVKLYVSQMESGTYVIVDYLFTAAGIVQLVSLIVCRAFFLLKHLNLGCFATLRRGITRRGTVGHEGEGNWEVYEEAALLRQRARDDDDDNENTPVTVNSLPSYGI